eukprot:INCI13471.11.p1 GENE.INCI13471.11~~INCI13471.11.p1  ORF type:complete len:1394 (+),score=192.50 INCI13471.11:1255-5436(+)
MLGNPPYRKRPHVQAWWGNDITFQMAPAADAGLGTQLAWLTRCMTETDPQQRWSVRQAMTYVQDLEDKYLVPAAKGSVFWSLKSLCEARQEAQAANEAKVEQIAAEAADRERSIVAGSRTSNAQSGDSRPQHSKQSGASDVANPNSRAKPARSGQDRQHQSYPPFAALSRDVHLRTTSEPKKVDRLQRRSSGSRPTYVEQVQLRVHVSNPALIQQWVDCVVQDVNLSTELALRRQHRARFQQALPVERAIDSMLRSGSAGGVVASKKEIGTKRTASDMGRGLPQAKRTNRAHSSSTSSDERHDSVATLLQQLIAADIPCLTDFASIPDIAAEVQVEETEISRQQTTDILRPTSRHTETGMAQTTIWGYSAGPDVKFQVELLQSGAHQSLVDSGRSMGTCATCHSATPTESGSYDTLVVRLVQGSELERAQRQLQNLGIHLRTAFGIEFDQILKTAAFSLMKYLRMMALSQWGQLQRGGGLRAVNQSVLQFVVWAWECKAEGTLQRLLFSENVLSQLGVVLQTFEAFDARSPTGSAQTMPSSAACSASSAAAQQSGVSARGCVFYMSNDDQAQVHKLVTRELGVVKTPKSVQASIDAISRSPPKGRVESGPAQALLHRLFDDVSNTPATTNIDELYQRLLFRTMPPRNTRTHMVTLHNELSALIDCINTQAGVTASPGEKLFSRPIPNDPRAQASRVFASVPSTQVKSLLLNASVDLSALPVCAWAPDVGDVRHAQLAGMDPQRFATLKPANCAGAIIRDMFIQALLPLSAPARAQKFWTHLRVPSSQRSVVASTSSVGSSAAPSHVEPRLTRGETPDTASYKDHGDDTITRRQAWPGYIRRCVSKTYPVRLQGTTKNQRMHARNRLVWVYIEVRAFHMALRAIGAPLPGMPVPPVLEASEISISNSRTILRQSVKLLKGVGVADTGALPCDGQSSAESCASKQCIAAIRDLKQHVDLQIKMRYLSKWGQILDDILFIEQREAGRLLTEVGETAACGAHTEDVGAYVRACTELAITMCFKIQYDCKKFGKPSERYVTRTGHSSEASRNIATNQRPRVGDCVVLTQKRAWASVGTLAKVHADDGSSVPYKILVKSETGGKSFFHWVKAEAVDLAAPSTVIIDSHKPSTLIDNEQKGSSAHPRIPAHNAPRGHDQTSALTRVKLLKLQISEHLSEALERSNVANVLAKRHSLLEKMIKDCTELVEPSKAVVKCKIAERKAEAWKAELALSKKATVVGEFNPKVCSLSSKLARLYLQLSNAKRRVGSRMNALDEAKKHLYTALAHKLEHLTIKHPSTADTITELANWYIRTTIWYNGCSLCSFSYTFLYVGGVFTRYRRAKSEAMVSDPIHERTLFMEALNVYEAASRKERGIAPAKLDAALESLKTSCDLQLDKPP